MPQTTHHDGPALRALAASLSQPAYPSPVMDSGDRPRDKIWELADTLHCSIVGTCLTTADGRSLLAKLGVPDARCMSEHHLHGQVVHLAGRREGGGKLLQKMLDRRHEREIRRFDTARTASEVHALWRESLDRGEILVAVEVMLEPAGEATECSAEAGRLDGRTFLYVGGRPRQVANLRRFMRKRGGELLSHDGGIEDSLGLLAGLVGRADLVLFPVECVSHEATGMVKRFCEATGTHFQPVRSASLASFVQAVMPASVNAVAS